MPMKMIYGGVPIDSLNVNCFEQNTNDATMLASDLQAGVTAYARGQKIVGTGKCFSFAMYGNWMTNLPSIVPDVINVIQIGSVDNFVKTTIPMNEVKFTDFATPQKIAELLIDGTIYPIEVSVQNGMLTISCDKTINIQMFYGKDEYA